MIISLEEAQKIDSSITQDDLDAFEQSVRSLTSNNFQMKQVRFMVTALNDRSITVSNTINGVRSGDTLELNYTQFNDGLYEIEEIKGDIVIIKGDPLYQEKPKQAILTLIKYPPDIKQGIKKLIKYDKKMAGKIGVKSETISRMSTTYYDVNATDNTDGYPKALLSFLNKYKKMRWS
ncbi:hypothetical protein RVS70_09435 [Virgibacillus sp. M23]|uniref:hypothetical protein n=1 Tax=Virgibacillus sp. M23 TaxID=3079030 RepID=UPI002A90E11A|nr:hypothetical protein [Virgibacillus sp. M23]MDY7044426.1 hypothetical protein [Virgibacillus sp. M23]